jgi:hypothetical protein
MQSIAINSWSLAVGQAWPQLARMIHRLAMAPSSQSLIHTIFSYYRNRYYDTVLSAMAGDRSDPEVAALACARAAGHPAAARFWGVMQRYGGQHVAGGGTLMALERLNLDAVLDRARPLLLTAEGQAALDDAKKRSDRGDRVPPTVHQTYMHRLTPELYPTASKLPEAWEALARAAPQGVYRFWDDATADAFLDRHFQPEVCVCACVRAYCILCSVCVCVCVCRASALFMFTCDNAFAHAFH